jgi:arylsulfatase A-like enzyme
VKSGFDHLNHIAATIMKSGYLAILFCMALALPQLVFAQPKNKRPNVILINCDDLGWGEISCYGAAWKTPNIDRIASEGARFTSFYSGNAFCTPSRAALLTGSYAARAGFREVLFPGDQTGLSAAEFTMAELFKSTGYKTACVGKWHLGDQPEFLPLNHGFDEFYGIPYSHDMMRQLNNPATHHYPPLPLISGNKKIAAIKDVGQLTNMLTNYAVDFILKNAGSPMFLYLPHPMPHGPLAVSAPFKNISGHGLIGDVITELDWSVGEIIKALEKAKIKDNTILIFTSDNGSPKDNHSPGPFRAGKGNSFEGGSRMPFLIAWPGVIPRGSINNGIASQMDLLPTFANLLQAPLSKNTIDGVDIWNMIMGRSDTSSRQQLYFFIEEQAQSMRTGNWKYHVPHLHMDFTDAVKQKKGTTLVLGESLFRLDTDIREQNNLINEEPVMADSLRRTFQLWQKKFYLERRPIGSVKK